MYSRNDYRYYLEYRLSQSDDFLAHYGVKGMKWKNHKVGIKINEDWGDGSKRSYIEFNKQSLGPNAPKGAYQSDKIGIIRTKNKKENSITGFNTTNKKYFKDGEKYTVKKRGRLTSSYAEDGSEHTLNLKKKNKRSKNLNKNQVVRNRIERDVIVPDKIERDVIVPDKIERDIVVSDKKTTKKRKKK